VTVLILFIHTHIYICKKGYLFEQCLCAHDTRGLTRVCVVRADKKKINFLQKYDHGHVMVPGATHTHTQTTYTQLKHDIYIFPGNAATTSGDSAFFFYVWRWMKWNQTHAHTHRTHSIRTCDWNPAEKKIIMRTIHTHTHSSHSSLSLSKFFVTHTRVSPLNNVGKNNTHIIT